MFGKTVSIIAVCLVFALAGSSGWFYLRTNGLESRMGDLERTNEGLTEELNELSKNSTTDLEIVGLPTWITYYDFYCREVRLVVKNNGASILAIVGISVNGTFVEMTPSILLNPNAETTINITHPTGNFIGGAKYEFVARALIVESSSKHTYEATFPALELRITYIQWGGVSGSRYINITLENIGTSPVTVNEIWVNNVQKWTTVDIIPLNEEKVIQVLYEWIPGQTYEIKVVTSKGGQYFTVATPPG